MVTRAARAARALSSAGMKGLAAATTTTTTTGAGRTRAPEKRGVQKQQQQQQEQEVVGKSREDAYDGDSASSSELSSLSSQSEFELSEEEEATVSKYFQSPSTKVGPDVKKRKRAITVKREAIKREPTPSLGDIVPAIIKHERKKAVGKGGSSKAKNTPLKTEPPPHWEEMYDAVKEMRSRIPAPVDTMGCERLADGASTPKIRRFQTLISLMLSSQTKDTVNAIAMKQLQTELPGGLCLESILEVEPKKLDELIRVVGFHNRKTEYIKKAAVILRDKFDGEIPSTLDGLTSLPGVGPKMAHLCMSAAWNNTQGIGVDVHVHRITNMWGWVKTTTPEGTREALEAWLPRDRWREINHMLVGFGQSVCLPRGRKCGECSLADTGWCRAAWVGVPKAKRRVVVVKDEGGVDGEIDHGEMKVEGEDFEVGFKTENEGRVKRKIKTEKGKKVAVKHERRPVRKIKHETNSAGEEGGVIVKTELDSPSTRSPVTRKRRRIKVEVKEEEDDDAVIADIEDIIPNLKSPR